MPSALVIGASRGLGLEFTRQYLDQGWRVLASCRTEEHRLRLRDLGAETYTFDILNDRDLAGFAWQLDGEKIDVIVINAGVYGPRESNLASPPTIEQFDAVMHANVYAVLKLLPLLSPVITASRGTLALLSTRMASIAAASGNYGVLYRSSKVAVNLIGRLAHAELSPRGGRVIMLHPGWVRTDMGGPNAEIEVDESIAGMREVIADPKRYPSGGFYDWRGQDVPW